MILWNLGIGKPQAYCTVPIYHIHRRLKGVE